MSSIKEEKMIKSDTHKSKHDAEGLETKLKEAQLKDVPADEEHVSQEHREGLMKVLTKAIGLDITTITLPVTLNEPASFLMRLFEQIQYSDLLDKAALADDPCQRLMYVSVFAASVFSVQERTGKPFNPLLGETYEWIDDKKNNLKFIAEQVSHHPPIGACHAENDNYKFWQTQQLKTRFTGNSLDCHVVGSTHVYLKHTEEHFRWEGIRTTVHNVIVGKMWLDHHGTMEIVNKENGQKAVLEFTKCGWFNKGWHEVSGTIYDPNGVPSIHIFGKWNDSIYSQFINGYKPTDKKEKEKKKDIKELMKNVGTEEALWVHINKPIEPSKLPCKFMTDWTPFTLETVALNDHLKKNLPPTDSRLRPDLRALEKSDVKTAASSKHQLEEKQREEERKRRTSWIPRYFKKVSEDLSEFEYRGNYFSEREQRLSEKQN